MTHKVRWYSPNPNEQKTVQVNEGEGWVSYKQSIYYEADFEYPSGFRTFQNCLKKGYEVEPSVKVVLISDNLGNIDKVSGIIAKMFNLRYPESRELVEYVVSNGECVVFQGVPEQALEYVKLSVEHCANNPKEEWFHLCQKN